MMKQAYDLHTVPPPPPQSIPITQQQYLSTIQQYLISLNATLKML